MPELSDFGRPEPRGGGSGSAPVAVKEPRQAPAVARVFARALQTEGERGAATRWSVVARYVSYLLVLVGATGVAHLAFSSDPSMSLGGVLLLVSVTAIAVTGALGMVFMPEQREEITKQAKHFMFGVVAFPGVGLALMHAVVRSSGLDPAGQDAFVAMLSGSIPWLYIFATLIPMAVFIKLVAGMRTIHSSRLGDEEELRLYTRQDGLQR